MAVPWSSLTRLATAAAFLLYLLPFCFCILALGQAEPGRSLSFICIINVVTANQQQELIISLFSSLSMNPGLRGMQSLGSSGRNKLTLFTTCSFSHSWSEAVECSIAKDESPDVKLLIDTLIGVVIIISIKTSYGVFGTKPRKRSPCRGPGTRPCPLVSCYLVAKADHVLEVVYLTLSHQTVSLEGSRTEHPEGLRKWLL